MGRGQAVRTFAGEESGESRVLIVASACSEDTPRVRERRLALIDMPSQRTVNGRGQRGALRPPCPFGRQLPFHEPQKSALFNRDGLWGGGEGVREYKKSDGARSAMFSSVWDTGASVHTAFLNSKRCLQECLSRGSDCFAVVHGVICCG